MNTNTNTNTNTSRGLKHSRDEDAGEAPTDEVADVPARGAGEIDTPDEGFLSPELTEFLRSFAATRGRTGGGDEEGGKDEDGPGKRKSAASEVEREGEAGERAGKKKKKKRGRRTAEKGIQKQRDEEEREGKSGGSTTLSLSR